MQNFLGEIRMFGGSFAPVGWAFCFGQSMSISNNDALYALIGTTYGGDGVQTFNLPDLRGRIPVGEGQAPGLSPYVVGESAGVETVLLTDLQMPQHNHLAIASLAPGSVSTPGPTVVPAKPVGTAAKLYVQPVAGKNPPVPVALSAQAITPNGGSQAHSNLMPTLCVNYIIALEGVFPARN